MKNIVTLLPSVPSFVESGRVELPEPRRKNALNIRSLSINLRTITVGRS